MATRSSSEKEKVAFPRRGDIYLVHFDPTVGHEIQKTRPAVVIQNDVSNQYSPIAIVAAISSQFSDPPFPREVLIGPQESGLPKPSAVIVNQLRSVDRQGWQRNSASSPAKACGEWTKLSRSASGWLISNLPADHCRCARRAMRWSELRGYQRCVHSWDSVRFSMSHLCGSFWFRLSGRITCFIKYRIFFAARGSGALIVQVVVEE
jgi:mRNA interferase MazF